tara:strand:- start:4928 stop:5815 length:888 start_codon:yes stop_codon:yes gene_type:complete
MSIDHSFVYKNINYTNPNSKSPNVKILPPSSLLFPQEPVYVRANVVVNDEHLIIQQKFPPLPSTLSVTDVKYENLINFSFYVTNSNIITLEDNILKARLFRNNTSEYIFKHDVHIKNSIGFIKHTISSIETHPDTSYPILSSTQYDQGDQIHIDNLYLRVHDDYISIYKNKQPVSIQIIVQPLHFSLCDYKNLVSITPSLVSDPNMYIVSIVLQRNNQSSYIFKHNIHIQSNDGNTKYSLNDITTNPEQIIQFPGLYIPYEIGDVIIIDSIHVLLDNNYVNVYENGEQMRVINYI